MNLCPILLKNVFYGGNMISCKGIASIYFRKLSALVDSVDTELVDNAVEVIANTWHKRKQIITLGNGGSSLTALHFINDWNKSIFISSGQQFLGRSLVGNIGTIMSYANDLSFQEVFVQQLKNIMHPGDLVVAISGSGNSENVVRAVDYANKNEAVTLGLCGFDGGNLKKIAQHVLWVDANDMQLVEDVHSIFGHLVMQRLCGIC